MQPKNSTWNIIAFFVCSALVLAGWGIMQHYLAPEQAPVPEALRTVPPTARPALVAEMFAMGAAPAVVPGAGDAAQLCADAVRAQYVAQNNFKLPAVAKAKPKPAPPPKPVVALPPAKREVVQLGDESYKLQVK